jgi:hypothetical protein
VPSRVSTAYGRRSLGRLALPGPPRFNQLADIRSSTAPSRATVTSRRLQAGNREQHNATAACPARMCRRQPRPKWSKLEI